MSDAAGQDATAPETIDMPPGVSIANHPRARAWIRRARARAGLIGFGAVLLVALHAGVPAADSVVRALVAGLAAFLATWAIGLAVWKQIIYAEVRAAYDRRQRRYAELREAAERAVAEAPKA